MYNMSYVSHKLLTTHHYIFVTVFWRFHIQIFTQPNDMQWKVTWAQKSISNQALSISTLKYQDMTVSFFCEWKNSDSQFVGVEDAKNNKEIHHGSSIYVVH